MEHANLPVSHGGRFSSLLSGQVRVPTQITNLDVFFSVILGLGALGPLGSKAGEEPDP